MGGYLISYFGVASFLLLNKWGIDKR